MDHAVEDRWRHLLTRRLAPATATVCLGDALHALNTFIVSTTMPSVVVELGGVHIIGWASTVFLIAAIVGGASAGFLKQRLGARPALIAAAAVFAAGTLAVGLATSMTAVLVGRALQGLGDGVIVAACYALVAELFPPKLVPKVFGLLAVIWALAAFGGPLLAGLLTETTSWRVAYLANIPLALAFAGLVAAVVPRAARVAGRIVVPFGRLAAIASGIMLMAVAGLATDLPLVAGLIGAAVAVLVGVFVVDRASRDKLFPSDAFSPRSIVGATLWVVLLMPLAQACSAVYLPLFLQHLWGHGPTVAGAFAAITALAWSGAALIVANIKTPLLARITIRLGPIMVMTGLAGAAVAVPSKLHWLLVLCQITIGAGFGVSWAFLSQAVMTHARPGEADTASGLLPTTQAAGYAIGAALFGLTAHAAGLSNALDPPSITHASRWIFASGAAFALGAVAFGFAVRLRPAPVPRA
ncbi:MFS transporter [Vineibacter terrae]|uniref:MFS transporter n=1 Tax=Vineibacter terrae TaxID=2586908 RepID=UPI002E332A3A|nr:MFS transporter [Vineibacter terrae]HEX2889599.1 MFS transporter [Vineibacter terrae]